MYLAVTAALAVLLMACAASVHAQASSDVPCPPAMLPGTMCADGQDVNGSFYYLARPAAWNGTLIVLDHGGPAYTTPPTLQAVAQIAGRPSIALRVVDGYALAVPSYRDQYWHVDRYTEDNQSARLMFTARFGKPRRTYIEGQSFGGLVAARTIERFPQSYDGAILVAGLLAGFLVDGYYRLDTRVVYQYFCHNLPAPDEPPYPLWRGVREMGAVFPPESLFTVGMPGFLQRMHECTGWDVPDSLRTPAQRQRYRQIVAVMHKDTADFRGRIGFAALLYSIQANMTGGRNVFDNRRAVYKGSDDDAALNRGVERYDGDSAAARAFYDLTTPTGAISIPVIASHSINDPRAPVENESYYRHAVERAGASEHLVQVYTTRPTHPGTSGFEILALLHALDEWVTSGTQPTSGRVAELCDHTKPTGQTCTFISVYTPQPFSAIVPPQGREAFLPPGW